MVDVDEVAAFIVRFNVTTESQPPAFTPVHFAELFEAAYVLPCQV